MGVGQKIKELRNKSNLTQKDLAEELHVTYQAVSRWENGDAEPSLDTIKEMCKIFKCNAQELLEIESSEVDDEVKEENEEKEVEEPEEKEEKVLYGICDKCKKPIYSADDYNKVTIKKRIPHGRTSSYVDETLLLCKKCNDERLEEIRKQKEKEEKEKQQRLKKKRIHSFIWPTIVSIICIVVGISYFSKGDSENGLYALGSAVLWFTFLGTMILSNTFVTDMWLEMFSWGFVKLPGVIFSLDLGGIIFLVVVKVLFFILGIALAIFAGIFATLFAMVVSIFVYPFALRRNLKGVERD